MTNTVILSGGIDSTTALAIAHATAEDVRAVSFDYGQRHVRELRAAQHIAHHFQTPHELIDLRGRLHGSALLSDSPIPHGHYADASMASTVVHGRNLLLASVALASGAPGDTLWLGVHAGDHPIYPDCRPEFWESLRPVFTAYGTELCLPFLHNTKAEVVAAGSEEGVPFDLTWSCYEGGELHCGRCGTCVERREAFALAGVADPTVYGTDSWKDS